MLSIYKEMTRLFNKHLVISDPDLLNVIYGTLIANRFPGDPTWLVIVGPSGGGKTEILRSFNGLEEIMYLEDISPKAFASHMLTETGNDVSLLPLLDGKILIVKDLAPILAKRKEDRELIWAAFRSAYDGEYGKATGAGQTEYQVSFGCMCASTHALETIGKFDPTLGERFLQFKIIIDDPKKCAEWAMRHSGYVKQWRAERNKICGLFLQSIKGIQEPTLTPGEIDWLVRLATLTCELRTPVSRNSYGHFIDALTYGEVPTRFAGLLTQIFKGVKVLTNDQNPAMRAAIRIASACVSDQRLLILDMIRQGFSTRATLEAMLGIGPWLVRITTEDLAAVGIIEANKIGRNVIYYRLKPEYVKIIEVMATHRGKIRESF